MSGRSQSFARSSPNRLGRCFGVLAFLGLAMAVLAGDFAARSVDRAAIERVYYQHRLGDKPPFEQTLPPATLDSLVGQELRKEVALQRGYGVTITPALLAAEVQRINASTRAPNVLAEIKAALGHDPGRFANAFAKPFLVERLLREKFDTDDALHAPQRRQVEQKRAELLAAKTNGAGCDQLLALLGRGHSNDVSRTTWQLAPRPAETNAPSADDIEIQKRFGPTAQILSSPQGGEGKERKVYFEDLPGELQNVLRVQLRRPGDVSAVIETSGGFLCYLASEKTDAVLNVAALALPKRRYEQWLSEFGEIKP